MIIRQDIVTDHIKNFLVQQESENRTQFLKRAQQEGHRPKFYPSSISRCPREIVYDMLQYPRPPKDGRFLMIAQNGDMMHLRYQKWFSDAGILLHKEYPLWVEEYRLSGKVDAIIDPAPFVPDLENELCVVELKSTNNKKFNKMVQKCEPLQEYVEQLMLYLHFLQIPFGIVIAENKDTQEVVEFWVEYDEKLSNKLVNKIVMVNNYVDRRELPPRPYDSPQKAPCCWCDFKGICWGS